jgi:hypothetical protein
MIDFSIIDNKNLFIYIIIGIILLFFFNTFDIKLNIILGLVISYIIIQQLHTNNENNKSSSQNILSAKKQLLRPELSNSSQYDNVVDFFFSIQDFYIYNPQTYEELVSCVDIFFDNYEIAHLDNSHAGQIYNDMIDYKRNALNALHSLINNIPSNTNITNKLNNALENLEIILDHYLSQIEEIHKKYLCNNKYNYNTKIINKGEIAKNTYDMIDKQNINNYAFY